jgi:hypothetical protein
MGTVLEMKFVPAIIMLFSLAACGNEIDSVGGGDIAKSLVAVSAAKFKGATSGNLGLTRDALEQVVTPVMLATIDSRNQQALLGEVQKNQGVVTWSTLDDVTISFRDGVIVATRGLGNDLMASDGSAVSRQAANKTRVYSHLNGEDKSIRRSFSCTIMPRGAEVVEIIQISYTVSRVTERCSADGVVFQNEYWFSSDQKMRKSRQWISEDVGYLTIEDLRR